MYICIYLYIYVYIYVYIYIHYIIYRKKFLFNSFYIAFVSLSSEFKRSGQMRTFRENTLGLTISRR